MFPLTGPADILINNPLSRVAWLRRLMLGLLAFTLAGCASETDPIDAGPDRPHLVWLELAVPPTEDQLDEVRRLGGTDVVGLQLSRAIFLDTYEPPATFAVVEGVNGVKELAGDRITTERSFLVYTVDAPTPADTSLLRRLGGSGAPLRSLGNVIVGSLPVASLSHLDTYARFTSIVFGCDCLAYPTGAKTQGE